MTNQSEQDEPRRDLFQVVLRTRDIDALQREIRRRPMDVGHVGGRPDDDTVEIEAYLEEERIEALLKAGWDLDVGPNLSAVGRERQQEVADGDRFEGGAIAPRGLGKKSN